MFLDQKNTPRWMIFMIDILLAMVSIGFAYLLRFSFAVPKAYIETLPEVIGAVLLVRSATFVIARVYSGIIRYTGTQDLIRILLVNFGGSAVFAIANMVLRYLMEEPHLIPYNIIIIDFFILTMMMTTYRMLIKVAFMELNNPSRLRSGVVIFGAGETGLMAKRAIERDTLNKQKVVAFIDDNPSKQKKKLDNVMIYPFAKFAELLDRDGVEQVVIAVPLIAPQRRNEIVELCLKYDTRVLSVPPVSRWIDGELSYRQLRSVRIEELLGRDEIVINTEKIQHALTGKTILVTGAAGSIGSELVRQILRFNPAAIVLLDQAETPLYEIELEINNLNTHAQVSYALCDITDGQRLHLIFEKHKPQIVFHAAAYKHVPMMEQNPREAVRTNVLGTKLVADMAHEMKVERFIMISTDKAVNPSSIMGASKRMAEIYTQALNSRSDTLFITTRFGNVLGSNGSVITLFKKQIDSGGPVTITHPKVTRYFMTIPEASRLVLEAATMGNSGEIFLFNMGKSVQITELAKKMIKLSGLTPGVDIQIVYTGLRPGEKLYEELLNVAENTIHTGHPHILVAKVRTYDFDQVKDSTADLIGKIYQSDKYEVVKALKRIIPEYISKNSLFEQLD